MRNPSIRILLTIMLLMLASVVTAQPDEADPLDRALSDLSERVGTPLNLSDLDDYQVLGQDFGDSSLGCPQPGMMYAQVVTPGFQVLLTYAGDVYDYRVSGDTLFLCENPTAQGAPTLSRRGGLQPLSVDNAAGLTIVGEIEGRFRAAPVYAPDGITFALLYQTGGIVVYRNDAVLNIQGSATASAVAFSPDSALVFIGDEAGTVSVYRTQDARLVAEVLVAQGRRISSLTVNPAGTQVIALVAGQGATLLAVPGR